MSGAAAGRAVVLLSGGLDSATVLAVARAQGRRVHALSFRYGQRHAVELQCAAEQARLQQVQAHETIDLGQWAAMVAPATALIASSELPVPKDRALDETIPSTYVPARNTLFLAYALGWAEALDAREIWLGVNALDYSGYPDCRPAFLEAFERLANLATRVGVESPTPAISVRAPLLHLRKHEIIALGHDHGVDYAATVSCYEPRPTATGVLACGACDSCRLRREGFVQAGVPDPTPYVGPSA